LDSKLKADIKGAINKLDKTYFPKNYNIRKLKGLEHTYRLRVGNVGNSFLRHFVLYLDYKNQRVIVEKGDNYDYKFPRHKSGLQLWYTDNNDIEVLFAAPNTPADEAGFKKGDIIKTINGIDVDYFDGIISIRKLLKEKAGITYTFEVLRNKEFIEMQLTLRELF